MRSLSHVATRRGSALVFSVISVTVVSILAAAFMQLAMSVTRRLNTTSDNLQALNLAEAGLAEAYTGMGVAHTGNVGSAAAPAVFGGGLVWVEAEEHVNGMVELRSTAMYGTGRATLGLVCEPNTLSVSSLGFFFSDSMRLNPDVRLDSYDSSQGSYASQVNTPLNNQGSLGSNGDVSIAAGDLVYGDVTSGPTGKITVASGAVVTGGKSARPEKEVLPPVEMPPITLGATLNHTSATPKVVPPGEAGFKSLTVGKNAKVILKGPLTLAVGKLSMLLGSELVFDTTDGPVELYVSESLDMNTSSTVTTTTQKTSDSLIFVAAPAGKNVNFGAKSQFYGFIYAPESDVKVSSKFEVFGGVVGRGLQLAAQGRMHLDLGLGAAVQSMLPIMQSWRVVDIPQVAAASRFDPFAVLGLDKSTLLPPAQAHEDQILDVRYVETDGGAGSYFGPESAFDWSLVRELLYGVRDGLAFLLPDDYAGTGQVANDPLVDLVASSMTSKQLRDALLAASPVSTEALVAACQRSPAMNKSDLDNVLDKNKPLQADALLAAIASTALDGSTLVGDLIDNSPLPLPVLTAALARVPPLTLSQITNLLSKQ